MPLHSINKILLCIAIATIPLNVYSFEKLTIVDNAKSNYQIIVSNSATSSQEAAKELQRLILKSTGVLLPIKIKPTKEKENIFIGENEYSRKHSISSENIPKDGYIFKTVGSNLHIIGNDGNQQNFYHLNLDESTSAGSYYGVLYFARKYLDANWFMPGVYGEEVKLRNTLTVEASDITDAPNFEMRFIDVTNTRTKKFDELLINQKRRSSSYFNQSVNDESNKWGRHLRLGSNFKLSVGHAWYKWMPAEKPNKYSSKAYGRSNPQYFAQPGGKSGKYYYGRTGNFGGQLCVCNPSVSLEIARNIVIYSKKTNVKSFSLSPNDGDKWGCSCNCCKKNSHRFLKDTPELTAEVVNFSNLIVTEVKKQIPDAKFGLYAYSWISKPPIGVKSMKDLYISDVYNGLPYIFHHESKKNEVEKNARSWREKTNNIVLTSYYTYYGHYSLPWSTPDVHQWLIGLLKTDSSSGVRMNYTQRDFAPVGVLGADPWVMSELLWNPNQSIDDLYSKFYIEGFGEKVGPLIHEYFELINHSMMAAIKTNKFIGPRGVKNYILPAYQPIRNQCKDLIKQAQNLSLNMPYRFQWRTNKIARGWEYAELVLDMLLAEKNGNKELAKNINIKRIEFLNSDESIYALSRASADFQDILVPLIEN